MLDQKIKDLIAKFENYKKDGWTIKEVALFLKDIVDDVIYSAQEFFDLKQKKEKKDWAVETATEIYFTINPRILPAIIPNFIETMFEKATIKFFIGLLIEILVADAKENDPVTFEELGEMPACVA